MASVLASAQSADPYLAWARVLAKHVSERGEVDFHAVAADRRDLDDFVDYVRRIGPRVVPAAFPGREAELAYYVNAYNALAMFNVIDSGFPQHLGAVRRILFFGVKRFTVAGERLSLHSLENDVIRPLGDERVHFVLNCMTVGCPRLPREPLRPAGLNERLDRLAREFFADPRHLQVVPQRRRVRVSSILSFYRDDFLARSLTLVDYINRYAPSSIPRDYEVEFIEYDWTVNDVRRGPI